MQRTKHSTATSGTSIPNNCVRSDEGISKDATPNIANAICSVLEHRTSADLTAGKSANCQGVAAPLTSTGQETYSANLAGIVNFQPPVRPSPMSSFHAILEWEGYVVKINDREFTARLADLTAGATYAGEEADIPFEEVAESDPARMRVGSIFRWVIGYEWSPAGTKKRVSQIVFRDLPAITKSDLRAGKEWANKIAAALGR